MIQDNGEWIFHRDHPADEELKKDFHKLVQKYFDRTGIVIEDIYAEAIGVQGGKISQEGICYNGGDERNLGG